jgi:hypothetical protein
MQNNSTGEMVPISNHTQEAFDAAIPNRAHQGIVLFVGEKVDIKGGTFKIVSMGRKRIILEGMPGTSVKK